MRPYYESDGITIYHADARDVLWSLSFADLVLTDPPYGINGGRGGTSKLRGRGNYTGAFTAVDDTPEWVADVAVPVIERCREIATAVILTPGNKNLCRYPQPDSFGAMYQPQGTGAQRWGWADAQPIFYYGRSPQQGLKLDRCSWRVTESIGDDHGHPCPKPFVFWKKLLLKGVAGPDALVLDPFMGSGTTLRAAKDVGCRAIGIDIEERWCEAAARRMSQGVLL